MKTLTTLLISLSLSISLLAQNKIGIANVSDNFGFLIPNAIVKLSPISDPATVYEYVCDKNGNYTFDIPNNDTSYTLNISPSVQSLQFTHTDETITLLGGHNGIIFHKVDLINSNGIIFTVTDTSGNPVSGAKVMLYDTKEKWNIDSCRITKAKYTDINGQTEIRSLLPQKYLFNIRKNYNTNRFTIDSTSSSIDTNNTTNITVVIRDLNTAELQMCGLCDDKTWITDSMILFGITMPYDADTKLLSDATWWDSNGRFGYWWFNDDRSVMTYNYTDGTSQGSIIDATNLTITDTSWVGDMDFNGMPVTYFMSVPQLDNISLSVSVMDTVIFLKDNGTKFISPDDLFIKATYCPTCEIQLSQYYFTVNDIGDVPVSVFLIDRCNNIAIDTMIITIAETISAGINTPIKSNISIYPNPSQDVIHFESSDDNIRRIEIFAINGALLNSVELNTKQYSYKVSDLSKGIYISKIHTTKGVIIKKIIIN